MSAESDVRGSSSAAGDGSELAALVATHADGVYRFLRALTRNPELARDLTQETFLRLDGARPSGEPAASPVGYLFAVARNVAISHLRRRRLERRHFAPRAGTALNEVAVDLIVPVAPGETLDQALRLVRKSAVRTQPDGTCSYTFSGDFPEDRIYQRKVRLPRGARLVATEPPALVSESDGCPLLIWRRYYPARQVLPLTVTYRLP